MRPHTATAQRHGAVVAHATPTTHSTRHRHLKDVATAAEQRRSKTSHRVATPSQIMNLSEPMNTSIGLHRGDGPTASRPCNSSCVTCSLSKLRFALLASHPRQPRESFHPRAGRAATVYTVHSTVRTVERMGSHTRRLCLLPASTEGDTASCLFMQHAPLLRRRDRQPWYSSIGIADTVTALASMPPSQVARLWVACSYMGRSRCPRGGIRHPSMPPAASQKLLRELDPCCHKSSCLAPRSCARFR